MSEKRRWLSAEWRQRCLDAMRLSMDVHDDLKREMIQFLIDEGFWDQDLKWASAVNKFNACLRPDDPTQFSNVALWALVKRFERFDWFYAMAADLGFEVRRKSTEERKLELLERIAAAVEANNKTVGAALNDLQTLEPALVSRLHRVIKDGDRPSFSLDENEPVDLGTWPRGVPSV